MFTASDALVLLGHGTVLNPDSCTTVFHHAQRLRERGIFGQVESAFWKQEPRIKDVLEQVRTRRVFIVPMFISEGYFSRQVIPEALGFRESSEAIDRQHCRVLHQSGRVFCYTEPVGTHPKMTSVLLQSVEDVLGISPGRKVPPHGATTLLIAGHGTSRNPDSRKSVEHQAELISRKGNYAAVHAMFMEEEPLISDWRQRTHTPYAVVAPFFISEGLHVAEDIPVLLGESAQVVKERLARRLPPWPNPTEKQGVQIWYSQNAGAHPLLCEIILARAEQAAAVAD